MKVQLSTAIDIAVSTEGHVTDDDGKKIIGLQPEDFNGIVPDQDDGEFKYYSFYCIVDGVYTAAVPATGPSFSSPGDPPEPAEWDTTKFEVYGRSKKFSEAVYAHFGSILVEKAIEQYEND